MTEQQRFYPSEENLGRECRFWNSPQRRSFGCNFPKMQMEGRTSCEGIVDDVCLFLKNGRKPASLSEEQIRELKTRAPQFNDKQYIPPGDILP